MVLSVREEALDGQTDQANLLPTTKGGRHPPLGPLGVSHRANGAVTRRHGGLEVRTATGSFLEKVRSHLLHGDVSADLEEKPEIKSLLLNDRDLVWHTPVGKGEPVSAIHRALISDLLALVHLMHGHPVWPLLLHCCVNTFADR